MLAEPTDDITFRWLGVSGVEITLGGYTALIDPLFTHVPLRRVLFSRLQPDDGEIRGHNPHCDGLFITHAHYDHLLDAPQIARLCGAPLYGSANTCAITRRCGVAADGLRLVTPGQSVQAGPWTVMAHSASHTRLPLHGQGPAPLGTPPYRSAQYRMDGSLSYLFEAGGRRLLAGPGVCACAEPLDVLFCSPTTGYEPLEALLRATTPALFVPIHWDDLFRRKDTPLPGLDPTRPTRRFDLDRLLAIGRSCGARCLLPERHRRYSLQELIR